MKLAYKLVAAETLIAGYVLLFLRHILAAPFVYGRLLLLFIGGTVMAVFVQGQPFGTIHPVSTRAIWLVLGLLLMGAALLWSFALKGHL